MKKAIAVVFVGVLISLLGFLSVKQWEENKRQLEFELRAEGHTTAIRIGFEHVWQHISDIQREISYDIYADKQKVTNPKDFMPLAARLLANDSALVASGWAIPSGKHDLSVIYHDKGSLLFNHLNIDDWKHAVQVRVIPQKRKGDFHDNDGDRDMEYILQIIALIGDQGGSNAHANRVAGHVIGALITEWDISTVVEKSLIDVPTAAQDIRLSIVHGTSEESLYFHPSRSRTAKEKDIQGDIRHSIFYTFTGMKWHLEYIAAPKFERDFPIVIAWLILGVGLLLSIVFARYIYDVARRTSIIEAEVASRTEALARSEEHFRSIVDNLQDVYYKVDVQGVIQQVSASVRTLGYQPEDVLGRNIADFYWRKNDRDKLLKALQASEHGMVQNFHIEVMHKGGGLRWVSSNSQYVYDDKHNIVGVEGTLRDFTESKINAEKIQHRDRLESLGVLAGGIAHDFNNLLTAILGNANLMSLSLDKASPLHAYVDVIEQASLSAADLCKQMLAYAGEGKYLVQPADLSAITKSMTAMLHTSLGEHAVLEYHLQDRLPLINADHTQLQQVVMNLVLNAIESFEGGQGIVSVTTGAFYADSEYLKHSMLGEELQPGHYVFLEVSDTGCGMSEEVQSKIFEPFFTTKFTGRGLGMSAMLGIVQSHHACLRVDSKLGEGSTIRVMFPMSKEQAEVSEVTEATILIIDDEEGVREIAKMMLESMGYKTLIASGGEHGIEIFRQHQGEISLVILDMTMPKMNGAACLHALRSINANVRVVISSGYSQEKIMKQMTHDVPDGFLTKPYRIAAVKEVLRKHISIEM